MANTVIALRQSGATGNTPSLGVLANGELSLNYADSILYFKTAANTLGSIRTTQPAGLTTEVQFNDAGSFGTDSNFTFNKTNDILTVVGGVIAAGINVAPAITSNAAYSAAAYGFANTVNVKVDSAFAFANTVNIKTDAAFTKANAANVLAQAAFNQANTDFTGISVTPGTYGNASAIPSVTVDANGRISAVTTESFTAATIADVLALSIALG
jgi:hypothetical protein